MKATIHKLLTGAFLVVLTVFGFTVLSSIDHEDTRVWGFTNETCNSEWSMLFQSLAEMLEYEGRTDQWGMTWNFESYYKSSEVNAGIVKCHLVGQVDPTIVVAKPKPKIIPPPPPPPQVPAKPQEPPPPSTEPEQKSELSQSKLDDLKLCWEQKVSLAELEGWDKDIVDDASWVIEEGGDVKGSHPANGYGYTEIQKRIPLDKKKKPYQKIIVKIYTDTILSDKKRFNPKHLAIYTQMHEKYHVFQGKREAIDDDGRMLPSPYEWYEMEVEAYKYADSWWRSIFSTSPPYSTLSETAMYRYKGKDGKYKGRFKTKREEYMAIEDKIAKGIELTLDDKKDKAELEEWFKERRSPKSPHPTGAGAYDKNKALECD